MNEQKNDKWLDELISGSINTQRPEFDAEKWKHKYPEQFQVLQSRAAKASASFRRNGILKSPIVKFAAAAVIILTIGFFMTRSKPDKKIEITKVTNATKSPAEMLTLRSLTIAYRKGGIEAVGRQCDEAIEKLGPKSKNINIQELFMEINGV